MGELLWRLHPNGKRNAAVSLPGDEARRVRERGWLKVNGHRATTHEILKDERGGRLAFRIVFDENFPEPHP